MKYFTTALPFVALTGAFVIPSEEVLSKAEIEDHHDKAWYDSALSKAEDIFAGVEEKFEDVTKEAEHSWTTFSEKSRSALDEAFAYANNVAEDAEEKFNDKSEQLQSWYTSASDNVHDILEAEGHHGHHGHHGKHPHHDPNQTVYQVIAQSGYTNKLAALVNEFDDLVEMLNSTKANYTFFAPVDKAFEKIPDHAPKPSKEQLRAILDYHIIPDYYPAGRVLVSHTAPTLLKSDSLASSPEPQRISFNLGLRGLTVNYYARIFALNAYATNGVLHGIDSLLLPPPSVISIIDLFPTGFSTLELGLGKTGLLDTLNTTAHAGGTFFAPSNTAFKKLGPRINAFLFSQYGLKYLKALLKYHVAPDNTLYSDAYYHADDATTENVPKGYFHIDLPTMLDDRTLAVDFARWGGLIDMKVNAFARVAVQDVVALDGVIQVMDDVLVPPKKIGGGEEKGFWDGEREMSVEEFVERLEPFVPKGDL